MYYFYFRFFASVASESVTDVVFIGLCRSEAIRRHRRQRPQMNVLQQKNIFLSSKSAEKVCLFEEKLVIL